MEPTEKYPEPTEDRLLIQPIKEPDRTAGGLYVHKTQKERPNRGVVVAAGPGRLTDQGVPVPMRAKVGNEVLFGRFSGAEIEFHGEDLLFIREADVIAIVR